MSWGSDHRGTRPFAGHLVDLSTKRSIFAESAWWFGAQVGILRYSLFALHLFQLARPVISELDLVGRTRASYCICGIAIIPGSTPLGPSRPGEPLVCYEWSVELWLITGMSKEDVRIRF